MAQTDKEFIASLLETEIGMVKKNRYMTPEEKEQKIAQLQRQKGIPEARTYTGQLVN